MNGLDTSHTRVPEPHRTATGHWTTLIGSVARQADPSADDANFAGDSGVRVGSADEPDVPKERVWNQEAEGDPVLTSADVVTVGTSGGTEVEPGFIPRDEAFGAHQIITGEGNWKGGRTGSADGHSEYRNGNHGN
ncbi:hypothetical protein [Streptomyces sp. NPDC005438]|uniref:hypothetical protein n=1 Tax=Streptomyces sp. NPDC005438 TaxID=3156880 RepID=UPI00339ED346